MDRAARVHAVAARDAAELTSGENGLTLAEHEELVRAAGFRDTGVVWQSGTSRVPVAVLRGPGPERRSPVDVVEWSPDPQEDP